MKKENTMMRISRSTLVMSCTLILLLAMLAACSGSPAAPAAPTVSPTSAAESIAQQYTAASNSKNVDQYLSLFAPDAITMDYGSNFGPFYVRDITDDIHVYYSSKYFQYQVNSSFVSSDGRFAALEGIYTDWIHGGNQTASVPCLVILEMKDGKIIKESIYYNSAPLFN